MRLKHATIAQDDATEALATAFVQQGREDGAESSRGASEVDEFIKQFKEGRKIYHKRALWAEKWSSGHIIWRED